MEEEVDWIPPLPFSLPGLYGEGGWKGGGRISFITWGWREEGEGEEQLLRMTQDEEGVELLWVPRGESEEEKGSRRSRKKDLARFLGVESNTFYRRKNTVLRSFDSCSYSSSQIYSTLDSVLSAKNPSKTSSEYYLSTKL